MTNEALDIAAGLVAEDDQGLDLGALLCDDPSCSALPGEAHAPWCTGSDTLAEEFFDADEDGPADDEDE